MAGVVVGPGPGTCFSVLAVGIFLVCFAIMRHAPIRS
jgi:hypothetical protein